MPHEIETRAQRIELRADGGTRKLTWFPIVFNERSQDLGGFQEIIATASVTKTLKEANIRADLNHDSTGATLASTRSGTLQLTTTSRGVKATILVPNSREDIWELAQSGVIDAGSFSFRAIKETWVAGDPPLRTVTEMALFSVSLLSVEPAYPATAGSVAVSQRALEQAAHFRSGEPTLAERRRRLDELAAASGQGDFLKRLDNQYPDPLTRNTPRSNDPKVLGRRLDELEGLGQPIRQQQAKRFWLPSPADRKEHA